MKAKRNLLIILSATVFVLASLCNLNAADKPIQLTYANFFPPTHIQSILAQEWINEIEKRTNNRVKITYYPGGSLLKGDKIYDGILKGIVDIGMSVPAYTRGRFPSLEAIPLPLGYTSGMVATLVINDFVKKYKPKELDDVKVMYLHAHGPGLLHTKKPVRTLEDLEGMKIRAQGFTAKTVKALGGVPVAMPQGGTYEALQKGVVEGTISPMEVLKGWKQGEVIKYTTLCYGIGYSAGFYVFMNLGKWNSLPPDIQKVFEEVSAEWIPKTGEAWVASDEAGREYSLSLGNELIPLSEEENARWKTKAQVAVDSYIEETEKLNLPAKEYVDSIREMIVERSK